MIQLSREIRFSLTRPGQGQRNSWAGWPSTNRIVPFLILRCTVAGKPNPQTGYVCNIKLLDDLLREIVLERLLPKFEAAEELTGECVVEMVFAEANSRWDHAARIQSIELVVSPFLQFKIQKGDSEMVQLTQQFEFSAAHRLHCPELSDEENRDTFGKCNNPEGHGHNYVVQVTLENDRGSNQVVELGQFESVVKRVVIDRLDHKHLNRDVEHFRNVIPSVENITIAIWDWLFDELAIGSARLSCVRVYETPKTWAEYRGEN